MNEGASFCELWGRDDRFSAGWLTLYRGSARSAEDKDYACAEMAHTADRGGRLAEKED